MSRVRALSCRSRQRHAHPERALHRHWQSRLRPHWQQPAQLPTMPLRTLRTHAYELHYYCAIHSMLLSIEFWFATMTTIFVEFSGDVRTKKVSQLSTKYIQQHNINENNNNNNKSVTEHTHKHKHTHRRRTNASASAFWVVAVFVCIVIQ